MTPTKKPAHTNTTLVESPYSWKSFFVYAAALICIIDIPLQFFALQRVGVGITSAILALFLCIESYTRLFRRETYLGERFSPILASLIISMFALTCFFYIRTL